MSRTAFVLLGWFAACWLLAQVPEAAAPNVIAGPTHDGEDVSCDLPGSLHMKNRGGSNGAGMCVMTSIEHAALWSGLDEYRGLRDWCAKEPGGGYPSKVDRQLAAFCKEKGLSPPRYIQYEGKDPRALLELLDRTQRMACLTYGWSPRYGQRIYHMVNGVKFNGRWAVALDNNYPGESNYEWTTPEEFVRRVMHGDGSAWVFAWLAPAPPPPPRNWP